MAQHVVDYLEAIADHAPERPALVIRAKGRPAQRLSYGELDARINRAANLLSELGVRKGDHVGCHLHDTMAHVDTMLGAWKLGAVPVNVNFRYVPHELVYLFDDADLKLVVTEPELAEDAQQAANSVPSVKHVLVADADYEARLQACSPERPKSQRTADDLYILYTGGTTGMPKGVMWRHEDALHACFGIEATEALQIPGVETPEAALAQIDDPPPAAQALRTSCPLLPLMHGGGQWALCRGLVRGGCVVIIADVSFDPLYALKVFAEEEVAVVWAAGDAHARPILDALQEHHHGVLDLPKLLLWVTSAVMITPAVKAGIAAALPGTFVFDGLGASETGGQGTAVGYNDQGSPRFMMSEGAIILDDYMKPIPRTERRVGKLAKTGHIPLGYYKDPTKTEQTFPTIDGVRYSVPGDLARWEEDGSITLFGRGSVSINSGGEKVYPEEVEKALKTHPAVFDAVVVGVPDDRFGKRVAAIVQLRSNHPNPGLEALAEHCRKSIASFKVPRQLIIREKIVRSPSGKPDYPWASREASDAPPAPVVPPAPPVPSDS
jgi:acyl-CoA synthetase (AMP-forming)/AMP-acid ligase II